MANSSKPGISANDRQQEEPKTKPKTIIANKEEKVGFKKKCFIDWHLINSWFELE